MRLHGMIIMALFWSPNAQTLPLGFHSGNLHDDPRRDSVYTDPTNDTSTKRRLTYVLVSFTCLFSLAFVLGLRVKSFEKKKLKATWFLVHVQTLLALSLIISSSILVVTLGTTTQKQCLSAIIVCAVFYTTAKMCLYMFLLERVHVIRAPFIRKRTDDWFWVGGTSFVIILYSAILIWSVITPYAELSSEDGQCRIGSAKGPSYLLLVFDASINATLTIVFVYLLRSVLAYRKHSSTSYNNADPPPSANRSRIDVRQLGSLGPTEDEIRDKFSTSIKNMLWKNVIGSIVTFLASAANLGVFFSEKGNQVAFVCLVSCMTDVTCGVLVVHWLTLGSNDETRSLQRPTRNHATSLSSSSTNTFVSEPEKVVRPAKLAG